MHITTVAAAALAALALGACGSSGGAAESPADARNQALEGGLRFARCMREHGIDMPDPQVSGNGLIQIRARPGARFDPGDPKLEAAHEACQKHLGAGGGEGPSPAERAEFRDAFVDYARCMRANGVDVPDPQPGDGGLVFRVGDPNAPDPESPAYRAAHRKCESSLASLEEARMERSR